MPITAITESLMRTYQLPDGVDRVKLWDRALPGYGVLVGRRFRTYLVQHRVDGRQRLITIGHHGAPGAGEDGAQLWTEPRARRRAMQLLGAMTNGVDPAPAPARAAGGPTLRDALAYHVGKMKRGENRRGKVCSPRSIATIEGDLARHFAPWLNRPLVELDADAIEEVLRKIERETPRRRGANPKNPPGRAQANRLLVAIGTVWRSWHKRYGLPVANPTERLTPGALAPRDVRIPDDGFPAWYEAVLALRNPVRRDLQLAALFSGLRTESLRTLRWDEVDYDDELIQIERAKGDRPYTVPMTATLRDILERRQRENAEQFAPMGGDHGYVFPSITREKPYRVIPVAEPKERLVDPATGVRVANAAILGIHASRRSYNSVAIEIGCPAEVRETLLNHAGKGVNVRHYGRPERWDHVAEWAAKIEAALWERIRGEGGKRRARAKLRAVP